MGADALADAPGPPPGGAAGRWRRPAAAALALAALAAGGGALLVGSDDEPRTTDGALGLALARVPDDAAAVAVVRTDADDPQVRALAALGERFPGSQIGINLFLGDLPIPRAVLDALRGPPVVVAPSASGTTLAIVAVRDRDAFDTAVARAVERGRLAPRGNRAWEAERLLLATDGRVAVLGDDAAAVTAAIRPPTDVRAPRLPHTAGAFDRATSRVPREALVRMASDARGLVRITGTRNAALAGDLGALLGRDGGPTAAAAVVTDDGVRVTARQRLRRPGDLLALGPQPARPAALQRPVVVGVRDPRRSIAALLRLARRRAPDAVAAYERVRGLPGFDVDDLLLNRLTGTATLALGDGTSTLVATLDDGGPLATALRRIALIPAIAFDVAGADGFDVDREDGGAYAIVRDDRRLVRILVDGRRVAATTDPRADLRAAVRRGPAPAIRGAGALAARFAARPLRAEIARRLSLPRLLTGAIDALGAPTLGVTATNDALTATLDVPVAR